MKTITVGIKGSKNVEFDVLGKEVTLRDVRVRLPEISSYETSIEGDVVSNGFDLVLDASVSTNGYDNTNFDTNVVTLERYNKVVQQLKLMQILKSSEIKSLCPDFVQLKTYANTLRGGIPRSIPRGLYVAKPLYGARGIFVLQFHTDDISPQGLSELLSLKMDELSKMDSDDLKRELSKHKITLLKGDYRDSDRIDSLLPANSFMIQEFNNYRHVIELRVIKFCGVDPLVYNREDLLEESFNYSTKFKPINDKVQDMLTQIKSFIANKHFPMITGSVDVWFDPDTYKWGIYEYQPQYNHANIDHEEHVEFMKQGMCELLDKYLPGWDK